MYKSYSKYSHIPIAVFVRSASFWLESFRALWILFLRLLLCNLAISASLYLTSRFETPTPGPASVRSTMSSHRAGSWKDSINWWIELTMSMTSEYSGHIKFPLRPPSKSNSKSSSFSINSSVLSITSLANALSWGGAKLLRTSFHAVLLPFKFCSKCITRSISNLLNLHEDSGDFTANTSSSVVVSVLQI